MSTFISCSQQRSSSPLQQWVTETNKLKVLSTTAMIDDLVSKIGGERIVHLSLINGDIDPHSYELVKGDDEKLSLAQVIFYNGLGLEHGASLRYQLESHINAVAVGNHILKQFPQQIIYVGNEVDPHIWMDVSLWSEIIDPIRNSLAQLDPEGAGYYAENASHLKEELLQAHQKIFNSLQAIPEKKRYLVTSHDAFNYFARAYLSTEQEKVDNSWRVRFEAPEGLAPDGQLSASDIRNVVNHLLAYQITVVFPESNVSRDSLKKIVQVCAKENLSVTISNQVLYGDTMGSFGGAFREDAKESSVTTYLEMMQHNTAVLLNAWELVK